MINNDQSTLSYCCEDVKSHRSGGDMYTVPLRGYGNIYISFSAS